MPRELGFDPAKKQEKRFNRRVILLMVIMFIFASLVITRLFYLQIIQHRYYVELSERNQSNSEAIEPKRGVIYDRNGVVLADNIPVFSLMIQRDQVPNLKATLADLKQLLNLPDRTIQIFLKDVRNHPRFTPIPLVDRLTEPQIAKFMLNQYRYQGVSVKTIYIRHYPLGTPFAPVLGYVSRINPQELKKVDPENYSASTNIGKAGIEKHFETILHGKIGFQEVAKDASGRVIKQLGVIPDTPGDNLTLTIDSQLQQVAYQAFNGEKGALVAIQPKTGQVLALVSSPSFDPNLFVDGIDSATYSALKKDPDQPLFNRAIRAQLPFGSTIKPYYALEGLESGVVTPNYTISDPGYFSLPGVKHIYHDWKRGGHGMVNITRAIEQSCDVYFFGLAIKMGPSRMYDILHQFGFGQKTGIEIDEESPGLIGSPEWKNKIKHEKWYTGDTLSAGIGQGYMLTTTMQLAQGIATIAERGVRHQPTLLLQDKPAKAVAFTPPEKLLPPVTLKPTTWDVVINGIERVIQFGTGSYHFGQQQFGKPGYTAAGKTGTAQNFNLKNQRYNKSMTPKNLRDNSLFEVYAPAEDPQIAVAVIVQNDEIAGLVARQVIDAYFKQQAEKAAAQNAAQQAMPNASSDITPNITANDRNDHQEDEGANDNLAAPDTMTDADAADADSADDNTDNNA